MVREREDPRWLSRLRGGTDVWSAVSFSVTGEFGGSLCVCGHVEKQSFFLDILSMRCLSQIYPASLLTPILVLHLMIHPVSWQFTVSLWCRKTVSEAYWNDLHWGLSLTRGDLGSPLRHPERTHAILIKVTPRGTQACDPHWSH